MNRYSFVPAVAALGLALAGVTTLLAARPADDARQNLPMVFSQGLQGPESALYDPDADVYLVSNINGGAGDKDDNGFITRVAPDGKNYELRWIDGAAPDVTLNAPKGMAFRGNLLMVADIDTVRLFDRKTGKPAGAWPVPNATFLNDLAVGPGNVLYATDTAISLASGQPQPNGQAKILRFESDQKVPTALASGDALSGPNGLIVTPDGPVFVTFMGDKIMRVKAKDAAPETIATLPAGQLDGIERLSDGSFVVTSWAGKGVFRVSANGQARQIIGGLVSPADLGVDTKRGRLIIPELTQNTLHIASIE
jgi:sugar lactone lactonase YvrE